VISACRRAEAMAKSMIANMGISARLSEHDQHS
jgi:hypothetical protein